MSIQTTLVCKAFVTLLTWVFFALEMNKLMTFEMAFCCVIFTTFITNMISLLILPMCEQVASEKFDGRETFITHLTTMKF